MPPGVGDPAPSFEALCCDGETFRPRSLESSLGRRGAVLVFGGFVFSAIATNWWERYTRAGWATFDGVPVYGLHRDGPYAVNAFVRERACPFELFADVEGAIAGDYGLLEERAGMAGVRTARRAVFVLDDAGVVQHRWLAEDWISPVPRAAIEEAVAEL